jgi:hypothetical protein
VGILLEKQNMKKTASVNSKTATTATPVTLTAPTLEEIRASNLGLRETALERYKKAMEPIERVWYYEWNGFSHCCGIGFLGDRLIEYIWNYQEGLWFEDISLSDSAKWMAGMQFSEAKMYDCHQNEDEAEMRWLKLVQQATA